MSEESFLLEALDIQVERGGVSVLEIPSFLLAPNEVVSLIGPNGAGKSSLLLALARLIPTRSGTIRYRGEIVAAGSATTAYRRRLAMVFQEPLLFDATVFENVAAGLKIRGLGKREVANRVGETLERFRMGHLAERSARKLSGGEAQRTSLARAFAVKPEMIFLDEPFVSLDPPTREALMEDLARILEETSTSAVLATHDQLEALRLSHRMVVLERGRIIQSGTPAEVMNRPADEFVASFVGMENVLTGTVLSSDEGVLTLDVAGCRIELPGDARPGSSGVFCIRPEHVTISTCDPHGGSSARNVFTATIGRILPAGVYQKVYLDCGFPLVAYLTHQSLGQLNLAVGSRVFATFKATSVHLIRVGS